MTREELDAIALEVANKVFPVRVGMESELLTYARHFLERIKGEPTDFKLVHRTGEISYYGTHCEEDDMPSGRTLTPLYTLPEIVK